MRNSFPERTAVVVKMDQIIRQEGRMEPAERMSTRLVKCAASMEERDLVGWQMQVPKKGLAALSLFASAAYGQRDLAWIAGKLAKTSPGQAAGGNEEEGQDCGNVLYEICLSAMQADMSGPAIGFCADRQGSLQETGAWPMRFPNQFIELAAALRECGGTLRVTVSAASPAEQDHCSRFVQRFIPLRGAQSREYIGCPVKIRALLRLPEAPSVRLRTVISEAVGGAGLHRLGTFNQKEALAVWQDPQTGAKVLPEYAARVLVMEPLLRRNAPGIASCEEEIRPLPASHQNTKSKKAVTIGKAENLAGMCQKITLGEEDLRRHFQIIGQTGTGKSTLLVNLILSAIRQGYGLTFFDPHGSTIDRILKAVPEEFADRIRVVRIGDAENPVPLGIWDSDDPQKEERNISDLCELFADIFDPKREGVVGPRYERWLSTFAQASIALLGQKASLESIDVLSRSKQNMKKLVFTIEDRYPELAERIRQEYIMDASSDFQNMLGWFLCKFQRLTSVEQLRKTLGAGCNALHFAETIDTDTVTLIDLASPQIGSNAARTVGTLTMMKLWNAVLKRREREKTHLVILDEASLFQTNPLPRMLAEGRKFGISMVLCHQHAGQLSQEVREALEANSASLSAFRLSPRDAVQAAMRFDDPALQTGLTRLDAFLAVTTISVDGRQSAPFTMQIAKVPSRRKGEETAVRISQTSKERLVEAYRDQSALTPAQIQDWLDNPMEHGQAERKGQDEESRDIPLEELQLSVRSYNCLRRAGIRTLGELAECRNLAGIRCLTLKCRKEIAEKAMKYLPKEEILFLASLEEDLQNSNMPAAV